MFTLGPHHRDAFALEGRRRLIDDAVAKLVQQGFAASYDERGRVLVAAGTGDPETLLFDEALRLSGVRRPSGRTTRIEYPTGADCVRTISPAGTVTEAEVSAGGTQVELRQAGLASYRIDYDGLGRPTDVTYPSGTAYRTEWGPDNVPASLTDRRGAAWKWTHHENTGQLSAIEDPLGRAVRFESNTDGLPTRLVDAAGRDHRFEYGTGTLVVTSNTGTVTRFASSEDGVVEARWGNDEGVRERLDAEQRLLRAEDLHSDDFVAFKRDEAGRTTSETTPQGKVALGYDDVGQLARIEGAHADAPIEYEYDADGVVTAVTAWNGHRILIQSDADGRIVRVTHPGKVIEQRRLAICGRPAQIDVANGEGKAVLRQVFEYDAEERLVSLDEQVPAGRSRRFSYDAESHLVTEAEGAKDKSGHRWTHDLKGNVTSIDGTPIGIADDDRPVSMAGKSIDWNADGCASHLPPLPAQPELWLQYGASQRLHSAKAGTSSPVTFRYDPVGRRTSKTQGSHSTRFRWCRHQMLREVSIGANGEPVVREWLYLPDGYTPIAMRETRDGRARVFSVHEDCRGAVAGLVDDAGRLVWHGQYDAFGACRVTVDLVAQPWRLQGQYHDDETGLHYNQARYYSPVLGHYLSRDPRWLEWEATNYSYGRNDPWNRADPSGGLAFLIPMAIGGVIGGVVGGIAAAATGGNIMAGIAGGAVGGAIGAIPGAGLLLGALAGAVGAAITDITASLMDGKEICVACVLKSAIAGAIGGLLGGVAAKALAAAGKALAPFAAKIGGAIKTSKLGSKGAALLQAAKGRTKNVFAKVQRRLSTCGPVSFATGSKFLEHEDFRLPGRIPIEFTRRYLSNDARDGWFGRGWTCLFSLELMVDATGIHYFDLDGRDLPLPHVEAGESWMDPLEGVAIERDRDGRYSIRSKETGLRYRFHPLPGVAQQFRLTAIEDRNGNAIRLTYPIETDATRQEFVHRPLSARDASGRVWRFEWDRRAHLRQLAVTLPADTKREIEVARYGYSDAGDLTSAEVFDLRRFEYAWNQHMLVSYKLPDGAVFRQEWDTLTPAGKCIRSYAVDGTFDDRIAFADDGSQAIHTDVLGRVSRHYFDEHHLHTGSIDAVGHRTHILLDPNGNPTATIDELGRETKTVFDARGNLVSRKDAAGAETKVEYGAFDLPIRIVDALGQVWSRSYDDHGNLIEAIDPLGQKTRFDYDTHGQLTRVVDAKGGVNTLAWSANGELLSYTDCSGKTTRFEHDAWGRPVGTIDALQQVSRQILDALGRVVEQRDAANAVHRFEWDPMDRLRTYIDPLGATTRFEYDKGGRPVVRRNALGREVRYEYDQAGRLAKLFNEKGEPYRFAYDALDRLVEEIGFDGRLQRYGYNAAGELTRLIEPGGGETGPGRVTRFDRDALGRLVGKVSGDDANATFAYDPLGRLLKAVNPVAATTFAYDALDNVLSESHALSVPGLAPRLLAFNHAYDPLGNRIETVLPSGRRAIFQYYGSGHLHGVLLDGEVLSNLERDDLHREVTRTQGALRTEFAYDPQGRLTQTRTLTQQGRGEVPIIDRRYRYDIAGRLQTRSDALRRSAGSAIVQREYVYQHDALGQLVGARLGGAVSLSELFAFDPAGNLLPGAEGASGQSAGLVQGNRLLVFQDMRFTYDVYGNVVEKRKGAHQSWQFSYDTEHRLTAATSAHHGTAQTTRYYYDPFGRRVAKSDAFAATVFGWDGNRMSHEARGSRVSEYLYEPESFVPLAKLEASSDAPPAGGPAGGSARVYHFHVDQIGTPQELTAPSGEVVWRVTARAWGNVLVEEVAEVEQPLRFQGQYHDAETGLHYNRYRYYDADVGRYASADPIGLRGGRNAYGYVDGAPSRWVDPLGLSTCDQLALKKGKIHGHHSDPKFLGGDPKQKLTQMDEATHRALHKDMNDFLGKKTDEFGNHMRPQRGNSGARIRENFSRDQCIEALCEFYSGPGAKYQDAANDFFDQIVGS